MTHQDVYIDAWETKAIRSGSNLYNRVFQDKHFKTIQQEAEDLGMNFMSAAMDTDEQLAIL